MAFASSTSGLGLATMGGDPAAAHSQQQQDMQQHQTHLPVENVENMFSQIMQAVSKSVSTLSPC